MVPRKCKFALYNRPVFSSLWHTFDHSAWQPGLTTHSKKINTVIIPVDSFRKVSGDTSHVLLLFLQAMTYLYNSTNQVYTLSIISLEVTRKEWVPQRTDIISTFLPGIHMKSTFLKRVEHTPCTNQTHVIQGITLDSMESLFLWVFDLVSASGTQFLHVWSVAIYKLDSFGGGEDWSFVFEVVLLLLLLRLLVVRFSWAILSSTHPADKRASASWSQHSSIVSHNESSPCNRRTE